MKRSLENPSKLGHERWVVHFPQDDSDSESALPAVFILEDPATLGLRPANFFHIGKTARLGVGRGNNSAGEVVLGTLFVRVFYNVRHVASSFRFQGKNDNLMMKG